MPILRIVNSRTNFGPSPTLSTVPFKMLPIVSMDDWRMRRLRTQLVRLAERRPVAFLLVEDFVDQLLKQ